jgi:Dyp-type peroxidase family
MELEKQDIQGLMVRGHGNLRSARFLLYKCTDPLASCDFFKEITPYITHAGEKPEDEAFHIAFTHEGLTFLNLPETVLESFSREFKEGMAASQRRRVLGDIGENDPENWNWGLDSIHFLLMVYGKDQEQLDKSIERLNEQTDRSGIQLIHELPTGLLQHQKEHFGFRDDISRPVIRELLKEKTAATDSIFPAGEFIMGYKNLYDEYAPSPLVPKELDLNEQLPFHPDIPTSKDLGKNGCYLVFRQMHQNVHDFWKYMKSQTEEGSEAIKLASKMVGRWPDGSPLTLCPIQSNPELSEANDFGYWDDDQAGLKCPMGAHIRRTNPRDHLVTENSKKDSSEMVAKHQMLRKGRPYGNPVTPELDPEAIMEATEDNQERGLHFICMVTDIRRQFEFVQNNWVSFHKFGGLENDADPIIGNHYKTDQYTTDEFSIPNYPIRKKYANLPNFTLIKGGAYFFFPGIKALKFITKHD